MYVDNGYKMFGEAMENELYPYRAVKEVHS